VRIVVVPARHHRKARARCSHHGGGEIRRQSIARSTMACPERRNLLAGTDRGQRLGTNLRPAFAGGMPRLPDGLAPRRAAVLEQLARRGSV
jgi:hypothetical protein